MKPQPEPIVKLIQPFRLRWFMHELKAAGIPFDVDKAGGQYKVRIADPQGIDTYNRVYGYKRQRPQRKRTNSRQRRQTRQDGGSVISTLAKWFR